MDANFRLTSKNRNLKDTELGPGWAYFVPHQPYLEFVAGYGEQKEVFNTLPHLVIVKVTDAVDRTTHVQLITTPSNVRIPATKRGGLHLESAGRPVLVTH
jgi:hypothetical protein